MITRPGRGTVPGPGDPREIEAHERSRYRAAAAAARTAFPGPLGELAARELLAYAEFGYRVSRDALVPRLAAELLAPRVS